MSELEEVEVEEGNDLMADLAAAWGDDEETVEAAPVVEAVAETEKPEGEPVEQETTSETETPETEAAETDNTPPQYAPAGVREDWGNWSKGAQDAWVGREAAFEKKIQENANNARMGSEMMQAIQPFQAALQMEANSPQEAMANMARTIGVMRQGTPQEKANFLAQTINHYGVDVNMLDTALTGVLSGQPQQQAEPQQQFHDPRVDQLLQQQQLQQAQSVGNEIQQFQAGGNEFMQDQSVRNDMADILDAATAKGQQMDIGRAYQIACQMNPQVQGVMQQRKLTSNANAVVDKKNAASSVSGAPSGSGLAAPDSMRGAIEQAWDGG
jgi:hypothetical protein